MFSLTDPWLWEITNEVPSISESGISSSLPSISWLSSSGLPRKFPLRLTWLFVNWNAISHHHQRLCLWKVLQQILPGRRELNRRRSERWQCFPTEPQHSAASIYGYQPLSVRRSCTRTEYPVPTLFIMKLTNNKKKQIELLCLSKI